MRPNLRGARELIAATPVALVADIESEAAARRKKTGVKPFGPAAILTQNPNRQPTRSKKFPPRPSTRPAKPYVVAPRGYALFVAAYREAAEKLRAGHPRRTLSPREFPASIAVRGWVGRRRGVFDLKRDLDFGTRWSSALSGSVSRWALQSNS